MERKPALVIWDEFLKVELKTTHVPMINECKWWGGTDTNPLKFGQKEFTPYEKWVEPYGGIKLSPWKFRKKQSSSPWKLYKIFLFKNHMPPWTKWDELTVIFFTNTVLFWSVRTILKSGYDSPKSLLLIQDPANLDFKRCCLLDLEKYFTIWYRVVLRKQFCCDVRYR